MFIDRKIIGIKRLNEMGDDELRQIAGQVIEELDAQVTEDGAVRQVEAELLGPPDTTHSTTHGDNVVDKTNNINEVGVEGN